ncbi:phage tail spike protein (plasmid) [Paraclostridium bifermentans]|uniref:Phage tail spike protein n=1 Tax=Paraclostridium bifermentans TaxID=1490 RepID=A0ABY8R769_PARBF|nr:phage tail spike protein [Paraclostridium bifermentans]
MKNKENEFVIKSIDPNNEYTNIKAIINLEDIKGKSIQNIDFTNTKVDDIVRVAIASTGWILKDSGITKRRTLRLTNTNALDVLREIRKVFRVDIRYDTINREISIFEEFGEDKGSYITEKLNLRSIYNPLSSYDYITRIYPYGKDGLNISSINNGKEYIDNFQYSSKIIEYIWKDERYTDINSLKTDVLAKLEELSKPISSYECSIIDLASQSTEYSFLDFSLGDTVTLLSTTHKFRDKQRIIKYIKYPQEPTRNVVELGNRILTFEELQKENEYKNQVVENITSDNGTIKEDAVPGISTDKIYDFDVNVGRVVNLTAINADINYLKAQNITVSGTISALQGEFGTLKTNVGEIDSLVVKHTAQINDLKATTATIEDLKVTNATIQNMEVELGKIQTLVNGNLSSENIQAGGITSDKLTISNGFIKNAMIESLDVNKINAGDISTNKFRIISNDGGIEIVGATQQFKDKNNKVRIQMGKDAQGNFNFIIRGEDGTTTLIDHTGIKAKAIADDLIVNNMIASDAVGEKQINYSSFANGFNKDTNTTTLKATKIKLDNQNQSLEVAFNSLKTQADGTKSLTESHSTTINVIQGQINTAINNTQIIKDGQTILLKDDYNRTVQTVNSMNSTLSSHTTKINESNGKIENVETKVNTVERDLNSITARVSSAETNVTTVNKVANNALSTANTANSQANTNKGNITNLQGEVTTVKSNVASLDVNLQGITQRVSSNESTTVLLTNQVNQVDGKINNAKNDAITSSVGVKDTRNTNENPQWYLTNYPKRSIDEFKTFKILGINTSSAYGVLTTNVPWSDSSGGYPIQTFRSNSDGTFERKGTSNTTWVAGNK